MDCIFSDKVSGLKGSAIREMFKMMASADIISFAGGSPSPDTFPGDALARIAGDVLTNNSSLALQYGTTEGYPAYLELVRGLCADIIKDSDDVITVSGAQQGIDLIAKVLLNEGDTVICETPSFIGGLNTFRSYGARLCGISLEDDGLNIDELENALKTERNVKLIYTIPTYQNPSGITMSLEKRKRLITLARQYNIRVIEDNPYSDIGWRGDKLPTLKSLDDGDTVLYVGSFSKTLSPGLRVGYLIGDKSVVERAVVCKQVSDVHTSMLPQILTARYFSETCFYEHTKKLSELYKHKCNLMLGLMDEYSPKKVSYTRPEGGLFIWCDLNEDVDTREVLKKSIERKVAFVPGSNFMCDMDKAYSSFRLNFSMMSDENIEKGIKILAEVIK